MEKLIHFLCPRRYADDRGLAAWTVEQVIFFLSENGFKRAADCIEREYNRDSGYALGEAVDGEKLDQICPRTRDQAGYPVLDDATRDRFARIAISDHRDQDKLVRSRFVVSDIATNTNPCEHFSMLLVLTCEHVQLATLFVPPDL